jgi:hypothetical protein
MQLPREAHSSPRRELWPARVFGVDFSGADDAGRRIWIAGGVIEGGRLCIESCRPAEALPGSGRPRETCLEALRAFVVRQGACVIGLDFPFGLPAALVREPSWEGFVRSFATRFAGADEFRETLSALSSGQELKRLTDREARTPFAAYNLRLYRQTYYGIRALLAPLVRDAAACVLPMQPRRSGLPWLLEICPASALKRAGLYRPYKGAGDARRSARAAILDQLIERTPLCLASDLREHLVENAGGDALDSVIAAISAARVLQDPRRLDADGNPASSLEGYVYV